MEVGVTDSGYTTFSLGINMIPVIGVLLGILLLGEQLTPRTVIALGLVLAGVAVMRSASDNPAR